MSDEIERARRVLREASGGLRELRGYDATTDALMRRTYEPLLEVLRWSCTTIRESASITSTTPARQAMARERWKQSVAAALTALREALPEEEQ